MSVWHRGNQHLSLSAFALWGRKHKRPTVSVQAGTVEMSQQMRWAQSFLFAGSSALLLLFANFFPQYWFLSIIALTPFLYRIRSARLYESLRLGFLFGFLFLFVTLANNLIIDPAYSLMKLAGGTALFTLLSWVLCRARQSFGFNPVITPMIWVGFELVVIKFGLFRGLFYEAEFSSPHLHSLALLLGSVMVSFVVVFLNSLIVIAVEKVVSLVKAGKPESYYAGEPWGSYFFHVFVIRRYYLTPEMRGPPELSFEISKIHNSLSSKCMTT